MEVNFWRVCCRPNLKSHLEGKKTIVLTRLIKIRNLSPSAYVLRLERKDFNFLPGQCVNLGVKGTGINREYSTYSGKDDPYLEFLIKDVSGGLVSSALRKLTIGTEVEMHGPYGSFTLDPEKINISDHFFLGTGTGIAPYHSYIRSFPNLNYQVIVGIRYNSERYDQHDYEPSRTTYCVSREKGAEHQGRITDYLRNFKIAPNHMFYLCGNNRMINDSYEILREKGASGEQIFTEAFF